MRLFWGNHPGIALQVIRREGVATIPSWLASALRRFRSGPFSPLLCGTGETTSIVTSVA